MTIEKLEIRGLFGYLDKKIDFFNDITLLVGINGAGKTSILNVINWIIKPSLGELGTTEFKSLKLVFVFQNIRYTILCSQKIRTINYSVSTDFETYNPLVIRLDVPPKEIRNNPSLKANLVNAYSKLTPTSKEKKTWDFISSLPNPTIIGLDRNLYTEDSDDIYVSENPRRKVLAKSDITPNTPIDKVKSLVNTEYRKRKNDILTLTTNLKNQLMLSAFEGSINLNSINLGIKQKLNPDDISAAEQRISTYISKYESSSFSPKDKNVIKKYFSELKQITNKYQDNPEDTKTKILYGLNARQFIKVKNILKQFDSFEAESAKTLFQINLFLDTLNYFLKDSYKQVIFKEDTSEIAFNILEGNGATTIDLNDIRFLSSGEQQILILFSYIAFNSHDGRIFIIDEPELSLHIKWQEDFLDYLDKITPKHTQLILATHSPILAAKKRERAIVLLPFNN